jgi:hypothetical protein
MSNVDGIVIYIYIIETDAVYQIFLLVFGSGGLTAADAAATAATYFIYIASYLPTSRISTESTTVITDIIGVGDYPW